MNQPIMLTLNLLQITGKCDTFNRGVEAGTRSLNHDLPKNIIGCIQTKQLKVHVRWMPSHLQDKMSADDDFQLPEHVE